MLKNEKNKSKIIWGLFILAVVSYVIFGGKYNAEKNRESLAHIREAKEYFDAGQIAKAAETMEKVKRPGIADLYPELKGFQQSFTKLLKENKNEPIIILGQYDDKFIGKNATLIINQDFAENSPQSLRLVIKGWAPQIKDFFPITVDCIYNNTNLIKQVVEHDGAFEIKIPVNETNIVKKGSILEIKVNKTFNPKKLSMGEDMRDLSFKLQNVEIKN